MTKTTEKPVVTKVRYTRPEILVLCAPAMSTEADPYTWEMHQAALKQSAMRVAVRLYPKMEADLIARKVDNVPQQLSSAFRFALMDHFNKTKAGAGTYLYNIRNQHNGGSLYQTNANWNNKQRNKSLTEKLVDTVIVPEVIVANDQPEVIAEEVTEVVVANDQQVTRWAVQNKDSLELVVLNLTSRTQAIEHNKTLQDQGINSKVWDKTKNDVAV